MSNVVTLKTLPQLPPDLPARLREMADDVESGRVTAMIVGYVCDGCYGFLWPSSMTDSLTIATLAQASALDRLRR